MPPVVVGLQDTAHVIRDSGDHLYTAVLGLVDVARGTNSFYKIQALEGDNKNRFGFKSGCNIEFCVSLNRNWLGLFHPNCDSYEYLLYTAAVSNHMMWCRERL